MISRVWYIPGGVGFLNHQQYVSLPTTRLSFQLAPAGFPRRCNQTLCHGCNVRASKLQIFWVESLQPWKTNMSHENQWLEDLFSYWNRPSFRGHEDMWIFEGVTTGIPKMKVWKTGWCLVSDEQMKKKMAISPTWQANEQLGSTSGPKAYFHCWFYGAKKKMWELTILPAFFFLVL